MSRRQTYAARTSAPSQGWMALLGGLVLAAGCFEPRYQSGGLVCAGGPEGGCPGGFYCATDNKCWRVGESLPAPVEGPETDAAIVDTGDLPPAMPPVLVTAASANPSPVTGTSTMLSVLAEILRAKAAASPTTGAPPGRDNPPTR